jgi:hypothetical protein
VAGVGLMALDMFFDRRGHAAPAAPPDPAGSKES